MNKHLPLKIALTLLAVSLCIAAHFYYSASSTKTDSALTEPGAADQLPEPSKRNEMVLGASVPPQVVKHEGKVNGRISDIKFQSDLETSIKTQEAPELWLEYADKNGGEVTLKLPRKANDILRRRWQRTLELSLKNVSASDREAKLDIKKNYLNDAAVMAVQLQEIQISTSLEKRKISEDESFALVHRMAKYAVERFTELNAMSEQVIVQKIRY